MTASTRRRVFVGSRLLWTVRFLAFPNAGVAGSAVAGRVDSPTAALVGGLITGAVIGAGQWLVSRGRLRPVPWILATALGMGFGLLLGATVVGFRTRTASTKRSLTWCTWPAHGCCAATASTWSIGPARPRWRSGT